MMLRLLGHPDPQAELKCHSHCVPQDPLLGVVKKPSPPPKKNVSLRGAVDLPECQERRRGKHKSTLREAGVDLPECQEHAGASTKAQKNQCFFLLVRTSPH